MSLDTRFERFGGKFVDDFGKDGVAGLVAIDADEEAEGTVVEENRESLGAEFVEAVAERLEVLVVLAGAAVTEGFGGLPAELNVGFGDIEKDDGLNLVAGFAGGCHNGVLFAGPAPDGREDEGVIFEIVAGEVGKDPLIENVGGDEVALIREVLAGLELFGADDEARREEFGAEGFGEADTLSVFAGHRETENVDRAGAKPRFDRVDFIFHI